MCSFPYFTVAAHSKTNKQQRIHSSLAFNSELLSYIFALINAVQKRSMHLIFFSHKKSIFRKMEDGKWSCENSLIYFTFFDEVWLSRLHVFSLQRHSRCNEYLENYIGPSSIFMQQCYFTWDSRKSSNLESNPLQSWTFFRTHADSSHSRTLNYFSHDARLIKLHAEWNMHECMLHWNAVKSHFRSTQNDFACTMHISISHTLLQCKMHTLHTLIRIWNCCENHNNSIGTAQYTS